MIGGFSVHRLKLETTAAALRHKRDYRQGSRRVAVGVRSRSTISVALSLTATCAISGRDDQIDAKLNRPDRTARADALLQDMLKNRQNCGIAAVAVGSRPRPARIPAGQRLRMAQGHLFAEAMDGTLSAPMR